MRNVVVMCLLGCAAPVSAQDWKAQPDPQISGSLDLSRLSGTGCRILNGFSGQPDGGRWGVLGTYEVLIPAFSRAVFYAHATKARAWPNMRNQGYPYIVMDDPESMADLRDGVVFFVLELKEGGYLAVTAMPGPKTQSWLHSDQRGRLLISFGTFGTDGVRNCDTPLFAWARSDDVYEACGRAINSAITSKPILGWAHLRHEKELPECFRYLGRCSMDYVKNDLFSARRHLFQSYANTLWIGQLVWCDHDMFHSGDALAGRTMAVSKAVSGGPVYLSDAPTDFDHEAVKPLCYIDGELLRPLAPAVPLPDSVFVDPFRNPVPYRVIAPLPNGSVAIVVYNLRHAKEPVTISASISAADYLHADAMVQPYPGKRAMPAEGIVMYDWHAGKGRRLAADYAFELTGLEDRLIQLSPIVDGWAVVGRSDKYLPASSVEILEIDEQVVTIRMTESGPLAVWSNQGLPKAEGLRFTESGGGLYRADVAVGQRNKIVRITR